MSEVIRIKASAGAGKTYQLSLRYLYLLGKMKDASPQSLKKIVAITFTNKAASEMKERILSFLKEIAFQTEKGKEIIAALKSDGLKFPFEQEKASEWALRWIDAILEGYTDFHVRTIDSLLYSILKALSFELGLRSELNVVFNTDRILDEAFELFLSNLEREKELWEELLKTFFELDEMVGFYPEPFLKRRLFTLYKHVDADIEKVAVDEKRLNSLKKEIKTVYSRLYQLLEPYKECGLNKNRFKSWFSPNIEPDKLAKRVLVNDSVDVKQFFRKNCPIPQEELSKIREERERLLALWKEYMRERVKVNYARVSGYVDAIKRLKEITEEICRQKGIVKGGEDWIELVLKEIEKEGVIPLVYAYFGSEFEHFLFDEFQDTSRKQWETLAPLVEEALSKGGSLFFVGDVKQAIYRWRGGDWSLFDEIWEERERLFSCVEKGNFREKLIRNNFRSHPELVKHFNRTFSPLEDEAFVENALKNRFRLSRTADDAAKSISTAFKDCTQIPQRKPDKPHVIRIYQVKESRVEDVKELVKPEFIEQVKSEWEKRRGEKAPIAVLLRRNAEVEEVSRWLLQEGIPVITENALKLEGSFVVKGLVNALSYIHKRDSLSLYGLLSSGIVKLEGRAPSEEELFALWTGSKEELEGKVKHIFEGLPSTFENVGSEKASIYELISSLIERLGLRKRLENELKAHAPFVERLLELAHTFEKEEGSCLGKFLEHWENKSLNSKIGMPEGISAVHVMTVHKAKGLEFPVVFVPFTNWNTLEKNPIVKDEIDDGGTKKECLVLLGDQKYLDERLAAKKERINAEKIQEELNLFYVALTRAKEALYLFVTICGNKKPISLFVEELLERGEIECQPVSQ